MTIPFEFCVVIVKGALIERMVCSTDGGWLLLARVVAVCLSVACFAGAAALVYMWRKHEHNQQAF